VEELGEKTNMGFLPVSFLHENKGEQISVIKESQGVQQDDQSQNKKL